MWMSLSLTHTWPLIHAVTVCFDYAPITSAEKVYHADLVRLLTQVISSPTATRSYVEGLNVAVTKRHVTSVLVLYASTTRRSFQRRRPTLWTAEPLARAGHLLTDGISELQRGAERGCHGVFTNLVPYPRITHASAARRSSRRRVYQVQLSRSLALIYGIPAFQCSAVRVFSSCRECSSSSLEKDARPTELPPIGRRDVRGLCRLRFSASTRWIMKCGAAASFAAKDASALGFLLVGGASASLPLSQQADRLQQCLKNAGQTVVLACEAQLPVGCPRAVLFGFFLM